MKDPTKGSLRLEGRNIMDSTILFLGIILVYFALQLWILPKLGIPT